MTPRSFRVSFIALSLGVAVGCSSNDQGNSGSGGTAAGSGGVSSSGSGGSGGSGSGGSHPTSSGGDSGTGGLTPGTGGSVTTASGGSVGTGGASAGGASTGGATSTGGGPGGHGGTPAGHGGSDAGTGGTQGSGGATGHAAAAPSPGCGKSGRPANGKVQVANESLTDFPAGYDGMKPFPLVIGLHACGNPNTEFETLTKGTPFETDYVRTFPNTTDSGQCWTTYSANIARILSQYDDLMANYCIDMNHVYAIAHSSGAQMLVNVLSHKSDAQHLKLTGISPVAADPFNVAVPMPVLYIDGKMDNQRSATSASDTLKKFRASNMCADTSKPYTPVMSCTSTDSGHPTVDPGCIIYDNCVVPTIWCSHNDPSYSGTEHGVPCFAMKAMTDFFATLP